MNTKLLKRIASVVGIGLVAGALLAGCGSDKGGDKKAAEGGKKVAVKTLISSNEAPLAWADEKGQLHGYEYDVLQAVNKELKSYELKIEAVPPETQDVLMESGEGKVAAGGYFANEQRKKNFILPENPIGVSAFSVYVPASEASKYKNLEEVVAAGVKLAPFTPNGGAFRIMTEWNNKHNHILGETVPVRSNFSQAERVRGIKEGQFGALATPNNLGIEDLGKKEGIDIVALPEPLQVNKTYVLVNKKEEKLGAEIDAALKKLHDDGTLGKISEKWYKSDYFKLLEKK